MTARRDDNEVNHHHHQSDRPPTRHIRHKRRRRWVLVLAIVLIGLLGVIAASPALLSTDTGRRAILGIVNSQIRGHIDMEEMQLSWWGPVRVVNLRVNDAQNRQVLHIESLTYTPGLLKALTDRENFESISVVSPEIALYLNEEGKSSLEEAFEGQDSNKPSRRRKKPKKTTKAKPSSILRGNINVSNCVVKVFQHDGRVYELDRIDIKVGFATLERLGTAIDIDLEAVGVRLDAMGESAIKPINLKLSGRTEIVRKKISGVCELTSEAGNLHVEFSYDIPEKRWSLSLKESLKDLLARLMGEKSIDLPKFSLDVRGQIDISKLARAVPAMLKVLPDVEVTSGSLSVKEISIRSGPNPSLLAEVSIRRLSARKGEQEVSCGPILLLLEAAISPDVGLEVKEASFESAFGHAEVGGTSEKLFVTFGGDLAKFHSALGKIFDLASAFPQGRIDGNIQLVRSSKDRIEIPLDITIQDLKYKADGRELNFGKAVLEHQGYLTLRESKAVKLTTTRAEISVDDVFHTVCKGGYDLESEGFQVDVDMFEARIKSLQDWGRKQGLLQDERVYSGTLKLNASIGRSARDAEWVSRGGAVLTDLRLDGNPIVQRAIDLKWSDAKFVPKTRQIDLASINLLSEPIELTAEKVHLEVGKEFLASGNVRLSADIAKCVLAAAPFAKWKEPPNVSGNLTWTAEAKSTAEHIDLSGSGRIEEFVIEGDGNDKNDKKSFRQENIAFEHEVGLDYLADRITLKKMNLLSDALSFQMRGKIEKFRSDCLLDLKGTYTGSWEQLIALLHQFAPDTRQAILIHGETTGEIILTGPARRADLRPVFHDMHATTGIGWSHAEFSGLKIAQVRVSPVLSDGQVSIPQTVVDASGGKMRIAGTIDLRGEQPVYRLTGNVKILEGITIDRELCRRLLTRFNPVFGQLASAEGRVSLETKDLVLPLSSEIKQAGSGSGHLDLTGLKVQPEGILAELVALGTITTGDTSPITVRGIDFVIRNGRVHYDNFIMIFPDDFDLRFYGSVGFDDTLDLVVSVPIRAGLLKKLKVFGPISDYIRVLEGVRVEIPLMGTRQEPIPDFSKVDINELIKRAGKILLNEELNKQVEDLLKGFPIEIFPESEKTPGQKDKIKSQEKALDSLLDLLR